MIKEKALTVFLFSIINFTSAEQTSLSSNTISTGYGAGVFTSMLYFNLYNSAEYKFVPTGPFYLKYEHKLTPNTGLGISLDWLEGNYTFNYSDPYTQYHVLETHRAFCLMARLNHYIWRSDKFEIYAGAGLGYKSHRGYFHDYVKMVYIAESVTPGYPFAFEVTLGERYFISKHVGIYLEVGVAKSVMQGGISYRF